MPAALAQNASVAIRPDKNDQTVLATWGTPIFPKGIDELHDAYMEVAHSLPWLDIAANNVDGFKLKNQRDNPVTSDGNHMHVWLIVYFFEFPNRGEAAVLFPKRGVDGTCNLHTAVFVQGAGDDVQKQLELLVHNLTSSIKNIES